MGEASNPGPGFAAGPAPSRPGEVDWAQYDGFAPGYAGWVLLANPVWDDGRRSFHASPSGGGPSRKFTVAANWGLFEKLDPAGHYIWRTELRPTEGPGQGVVTSSGQLHPNQVS